MVVYLLSLLLLKLHAYRYFRFPMYLNILILLALLLPIFRAFISSERCMHISVFNSLAKSSLVALTLCINFWSPEGSKDPQVSWSPICSHGLHSKLSVRTSEHRSYWISFSSLTVSNCNLLSESHVPDIPKIHISSFID